jgi:hypothetical protein
MSDKDVFAEYEKLHKAAKRMRRKLGVTEDDSMRSVAAIEADSISVKGDRASVGSKESYH